MSKYLTKNATQALGSGALTLTLAVGTDSPDMEGTYQVAQVVLAAASAISQVVTTSLIGVEGSEYTVVLDTQTLSSATTYIFRPSGVALVRRGDSIKLTCANSGTPAISVYGLIELIKID